MTLVALWCLVAMAVPVHAQEISLDALVRAYPEFLISHDGAVLIWKDGTRMPVSDGRSDKSFDEKLRHPSILDQLSIRYARGALENPPGLQDDPGRFRNLAFFDKMYGDCSKGEVQRKLTNIAWLPRSGGGSVQITTVNSVADRLRSVSDELMVCGLNSRSSPFRVQAHLTAALSKTPATAACMHGALRSISIRSLLITGCGVRRPPIGIAFRSRSWKSSRGMALFGAANGGTSIPCTTSTGQSCFLRFQVVK